MEYTETSVFDARRIAYRADVLIRECYDLVASMEER